MASDELTVARYQQRVARGCGWRRPSDWPADMPVTEFVNDVGEWFVSAEPWNFLTRPPVYLGIVNGQEYSELPDDFGRLLSVTGSSFGTYSIRLEDPTAVAGARVSGATNPSCFLGCITHGAPTTAGPRASARLDLGPIPSVTQAQAFQLAYQAGWTTCLNANDHILLPRWTTSLFVMAGSAWMQGLEQPKRGSIEDRLDRLVTSSLWQAAVNRDSEMQADLGPMRGGVGELMGLETASPFLSTGLPIPIVVSP